MWRNHSNWTIEIQPKFKYINRLVSLSPKRKSVAESIYWESYRWSKSIPVESLWIESTWRIRKYLIRKSFQAKIWWSARHLETSPIAFTVNSHWLNVKCPPVQDQCDSSNWDCYYSIIVCYPACMPCHSSSSVLIYRHLVDVIFHLSAKKTLFQMFVNFYLTISASY